MFEEIPQAHGGPGKSFKVKIFVNPGGTPNVTATNATVSVAAVGNSNHVFRITVTPDSNSDITLKVPGARKRVIRGPDGDARVKNMYIEGARESDEDIYLDFYYPKRSYYLSKGAFGLSLKVETHSYAKICFFDDNSGGRCFDNRKTASMILSRDSRRDHRDRTRTWTVRVASMDGTGATTYNVIVGNGPVIPPRALDCTFDAFTGLTVTPDLGTVESVDEKGCRRYEVTLKDPPNRIEDHRIRGTVIALSAPLKQAYVDAGAALFLDWADFYDGRNYSRPLADARPEMRLDETILYLRMRLPRGTVDESSVARTSGNGTYEHLIYPIKVVRGAAAGGHIGKHVAGQPLTAEFENTPTSHDGSTAFTFRLAFSDDVDIEPAEMRDHALTVTDGTVTDAARVDGRSDLWEFTIEPAGTAAVAILVPQGRACTEQGALCTSEGRRLSGAKTAQTIPYAGSGWHSSRAPTDTPALPALSIADDDAQEGPNAFLRFRIRLSEASDDPVTFNIATSDGTAIAGTDYIAKNRSKTIKAGRTTAWFKIHVIDDSHDEGDETFTVTISNVTGATIADGTATGTIRNSDPLQKEWLARFGRAAASDAIAAVTARLETPREAGSHVTLGEHRLSLGSSGSGLPPAPAGGPGANWLAWSEDPHALESRTMDARELLMGTSFRAVLGQGSGSQFTSWGQGTSVSRFSGSVPGLSLSGESVTGALGMDYEHGRLLTGFAMTQSLAEGTAQGAGRSYLMESSVTAMLPFARLALSDRVSAWGLAGTGSGELTLDLDDGAAERYGTDLSMTLVAAGVRGELVTPAEAGGFALALKADAFWVRTESEAVSAPGAGNLAGARADASRLRAVLDGSRTFSLAGGALTPSVALGVRHDGGDAETGTGMEVGAGLGYADPSRGLDMAVRVHGLAGHAEDGYREWRVSGSLRLVPGGEGRGLTLSLTPSWGADAGGSERLWTMPDASGLAANDNAALSGRLDTEVGYGLSLAGTALLTPYGGLAVTDRGARTYRVGGRLDLGPSFGVSLEGDRRERIDDAPDHGLMLRGNLRW